MQISVLARALAQAILAGHPELSGILTRCRPVLGRDWPWLRATAKRYLRTFTLHMPPRRREVVAFLLADPSFRFACQRFADQLVVNTSFVAAAVMLPRGTFASLPLPEISTVGDLAGWLRLSVEELLWFADLKGISTRSVHEALRHYRYSVVSKPSGEVRLLEAPKVRLKHLQRQMLTGILAHVPPDAAAHGFCKKRSVLTYVKPHVARAMVLRMDLQEFFPSISRARVQSLFRTFGYPEHVADLLGALCTTATPRSIWRPWLGADRAQLQAAITLYGRSHLPQGAPTSPAIANLCCWRLDRRLSGLAAAAGAQYTRYADDLAFSGDQPFASRARRFASYAAAIVLEEGFRVNYRKTRVMRPSVRQHLAGLVINQRPNLPRREFDQLKAILTNCARTGAAAQNRAGVADFRAHLVGRLAFVASVHPQRGARLRELFDRISWPDSSA